MRLAWLSIAIFATRAWGAPSTAFLPSNIAGREPDSRTSSPDLQILGDVLDALHVLQDVYFQTWLGTWPTAIDWTAAVMGTHVAAALETLSRDLDLVPLAESEDYKVKENLITLYFTHIVSSYFGQDSFAIRNEAYDDILWVVLQWLETIHFIEFHSALRYQATPQAGPSDPGPAGIPAMLRNQTWHGNAWISAFAHRARIFEDLASKGWDDVLCGGGMTWNPRLEPYKNAITNELFIAASVSMYLYFPGDANNSPWDTRPPQPATGTIPPPQSTPPWKAHDPRYLNAATKGYTWLLASGMTNSQGLFTDGFHISNYHSNGTKCDSRNDFVYTYNQGVLLTGQRGLYTVTGNASYLRDGHALIQSVINATGWDLGKGGPVDTPSQDPNAPLPPSHGLGRAGVLEEDCDARGDCSQDAQTFKGIYFHHLAAFCAPLDLPSSSSADPDGAGHADACAAYVPWIRHNADAALATRDAEGRFGMWWTAGLLGAKGDHVQADGKMGYDSNGTADYRNYGVPDDALWVGPPAATRATATVTAVAPARSRSAPVDAGAAEQERLGGRRTKHAPLGPLRRDDGRTQKDGRAVADGDPNDRGRGRTVETQGGGLAVVRALWEISRRSERS